LKKFTGFAAIFGVVVFWGISFISIKIVLEVIDPILLGLFRYVLAVLFVLGVVVVKKISLRVTRKDLLVFFLAGVFGIFLYSSLENTAMLYVSAQTAAIMTSLVPLMIIIGNTIVFKERFLYRYLFYVGLSITGVLLVVLPDSATDTGTNNLLGVTLLFLSIVSWTGYALMTKKVIEKYNTIKVTALQSIMALLAFFPSLFLRPFPVFSTFMFEHWAHLLFLGVVCSGVTYLLYVHSINRLGVAIPNIFLNFIPLVTVLANLVIFGITIGWIQIAGGLVVVITMTLLTMDRMKLDKATVS
jgi:drug/metabolite transporter (DMT)-like permease